MAWGPWIHDLNLKWKIVSYLNVFRLIYMLGHSRHSYTSPPYTNRDSDYIYMTSSLVFIFDLILAWKLGRESMEEELLPRSTNNVEDTPPSGASTTPVLVLSTMVALCGSLTTGCSVSTITLSNGMWLRNN